jgi:RNA polymerase sigma-70 factor (ECF subfamily)
MGDLDWGRLMGAAQTGDRIAYRQLLDALRGWLSRYYRRRLPPGQVDDAVQDALLAIHLKRHTYDPVRPFGPWLAAIARYKWIDRLRAMRATFAEPLPENLSVPDDGNAVVSALVIDQLLGALRPAQAAVIRLVKLQGRSIADAAALTGQSRALVKVNIHRGLAKLAAQVDEFAHAR